MKPKIYNAFKKDNEPFKVINAMLMKSECDDLKSGTYRLTVTKIENKASNYQFRWLYGCIYPLSMIALNDAGYEFAEIDDIDSFWKNEFASRPIVNRETGEIVKLPLNKGKFETVDLMLYCDKIRDYCSEYLNTFIPEPDKDWKNKLKEEQDKLKQHGVE